MLLELRVVVNAVLGTNESYFGIHTYVIQEGSITHSFGVEDGVICCFVTSLFNDFIGHICPSGSSGFLGNGHAFVVWSHGDGGVFLGVSRGVVVRSGLITGTVVCRDLGSFCLDWSSLTFHVDGVPGHPGVLVDGVDVALVYLVVVRVDGCVTLCSTGTS